MNVFDLLDELKKHSNDELDFIVLSLMMDGKLNSHRVLDLYMKSIEQSNEDYKDRLVESNTSLLDLLRNLCTPKSKRKIIMERVNIAIQRALYNLNTSKQFNMQSLNDKFSYDEDKAKEFSWYWREHKKDNE